MVEPEKLKAYAEECKTFSNAELEYRSTKVGLPEHQKVALEEIYRRREIKEQKVNNKKL